MKTKLTANGKIEDWLKNTEIALEQSGFSDVQKDDVFYSIKATGNGQPIEIQMTESNGKTVLAIDGDQSLIDVYKSAVSCVFKGTPVPKHFEPGTSQKPEPALPDNNSLPIPSKALSPEVNAQEPQVSATNASAIPTPIENKPAKKPVQKGKGCLIAIGVFVLILIIGGIASSLSGKSGSSSTTSSTAATATATVAATPTPTPTPDVPTEYKSALKKAKSYSDTMYMSKQGIYDQLTSEYGEQFSAEAAQYAVDNLDADYNYNALQKAISYQKTMSMSPEAIRDQLTSEYGEQFTQEQADYAIANLP